MEERSSRLAFVDGFARHFARRYALPPMVGRVFGWLVICEPPDPTIAELSDALLASRSAISGAVANLEEWSFVRRSRAAGERVDRVTLHPDIWLQMDQQTDYSTLRALAGVGLDALAGAPPTSRARLLEMAAFADFLIERMPSLHADWLARRAELRASGALPDGTVGEHG
ncbi:MAG: MarR family transcriptional regulator [Candidatus Dormiibacterota bacterium]